MQSSESAVRVHRLFDGMPILAPTQRTWESGVTFNAAVTYLPPDQLSNEIINGLATASLYHDRRLSEGVVAIHYRSRPRTDPGRVLTRSYVGLALFTPDLELLYRFPEPVLSPDPDPTHPDACGVEDPRITRIGNDFHMIYCGSGLDVEGRWLGSLCAATSTDLLTWTKSGPLKINYREEDKKARFDNTYFDNMPGLKGSKLGTSNKDGVLLPGRIDGRLYLLHRPMFGRMSNWSMNLAYTTGSITDQWTDIGPIMRSVQDERFIESWVGAGDVPLSLGEGRYLTITHTGNLAGDGLRYYTLDAVVLNFNRFDPENPESIVESRLNGFMVPTTPCEIEGPYPDSVGNVLFSCGSFERDGELYIIYGGGDTFLMAAKVNLAELLAAMQPAPVG